MFLIITPLIDDQWRRTKMFSISQTQPDKLDHSYLLNNMHAFQFLECFNLPYSGLGYTILQPLEGNLLQSNYFSAQFSTTLSIK